MDYFPVVFSLLFVAFQGAPKTGRRHLQIFLLQRSAVLASVFHLSSYFSFFFITEARTASALQLLLCPREGNKIQPTPGNYPIASE